MSRRLEAVGARVLVMPMTGKTDEDGNPVSDGGILLGRAILYPWGIVVSKGAHVDQDIDIGDQIMWKRDLGTEFTHDGITLNSLRTVTSCRHCGNEVSTDEVIAKVGAEPAEDCDRVCFECDHRYKGGLICPECSAPGEPIGA